MFTEIIQGLLSSGYCSLQSWKLWKAQEFACEEILKTQQFPVLAHLWAGDLVIYKTTTKTPIKVATRGTEAGMRRANRVQSTFKHI